MTQTQPEHASSNKETPVTFSFGKNWADYVDKHFSEERVQVAQKHLLEFLGLTDLKGRRFIDIVCGSGIHSLAAFRAGADQITSIDLDPYSVMTTRRLHEAIGKPSHWTISEGSALDVDKLATIPNADIVYSWGVLHHTGQMWLAVENVARLVAPGGFYYIALYNTHPSSDYWLRKKIKYNAASGFIKWLMEGKLVIMMTGYALLRLRNPFKEMLTYKKRRGMSYMTDIRDWLGGYPYEHASQGETVRFAINRLGMHLVNIEVGIGASAVTEYLFHRPK